MLAKIEIPESDPSFTASERLEGRTLNLHFYTHPPPGQF